MKDYRINIFYSDEGDGYIAGIPDLTARSAFGRTPEEALGNTNETGWRDLGSPVSAASETRAERSVS